MPVNSKTSWLAVAAVVVMALIFGVYNIAHRVGNGNFQITSLWNSDSARVKKTGASYKIVAQKPEGWFRTGQDADIALSAIDFNDSGGPLLFNHQGNIASNGENLILADRNNNRVLIWNKAPQGNSEPDVVLGQKNFHSIVPGDKLDQLNWPVCVATDGRRLVVCDTQNHRVLVWNTFPSRSGQAADMVFGGFGDVAADRRGRIAWPWAAWTNGEKLVITSTSGRQVLIWNSFPTQSQQAADIAIQLPQFGTPRSIGSNGKVLAIADHNAKTDDLGQDTQGTFFWSQFPTRENQPYDFFMARPSGAPASKDKNLAQGEILWGMNFLPDGSFMGIGDKLYIWNSFPASAADFADVVVGGDRGRGGYWFQGGDGSGTASANGRLYASLTNSNKIVGFNSVPRRGSDMPDFAIGSPNINTNTLETEFIISNPIPATDGQSLYALSDFDGRLYMWKNLPDESGSHPDIVYQDIAGNDITIFNSTLAVAGRKDLFIWNTLPKDGEKPDINVRGSIGSVRFQDIRGVAMDERYFYVADQNAGAIYVWEGVPDAQREPIAVLAIDRPGKLSSDGAFLGASCCQNAPGGGIALWRISDIASRRSEAQPHRLLFGGFHLNLPGSALLYDGVLFVADNGGNRVLVWNKAEDAILGQEPDVILGKDNLTDTTQAIGRDSLFMPNALAFDGSFLWVGEVKFSERLLRFSVR